MPVVLRIKGYKFFFFSNEGDEPVHVHINKAEKNGKIWLEPKILDEYFYGFKPSEIKEIREIVNNNSELLKNSWNE
jgi:hypothetical protein